MELLGSLSLLLGISPDEFFLILLELFLSLQESFFLVD